MKIFIIFISNDEPMYTKWNIKELWNCVFLFIELLSPTKLSNRVSIPGLFDKECQVSDPWGSLLKLIILLGQLMDWDVPPDLFSEPR